MSKEPQLTLVEIAEGTIRLVESTQHSGVWLQKIGEQVIPSLYYKQFDGVWHFANRPDKSTKKWYPLT